ncbi:c-type cytochrome [Rubritepida flocculans]|jgi:cytochrome c|uniref:c-type cytochrome n=1 Tax=Rubritepida flocculans TaxID=182403 RepID=UPI00041441EE|nr:cytochrome c family protein [Rubritepida flocculans]
MRFPLLAAALAAALPLTAQAQEAGNPENGQRLFNQCRACHTANQGGRNGVGPNLYGVVGRPAGAIEGFRYSANLRERAAAGLVWNEENLLAYLRDPKAVLPQGNMSFQGFRDNVQNARDVIAYLRRNAGG